MTQQHLTPDLDAALDAIDAIEQWAEAYPESMFPEPDLRRANEVLAAAGISMSAMHGTWGRHIVSGIAKHARQAKAALRGELAS